MNYYERYCGDYARDTGHLSLQEHGAYTLMLDTYYATGMPLPADYKALYRICRAMGAKEQDSVRKVADEFFKIAPDGFRHNPKADKIIADALPRIEAAKLNGAKGGRPKKEPTGLGNENPPGNPLGSKTEPTGKAHQHQHQGQEQKHASPSAPFDSFWKAWPPNDRKQAKGKCWDLWRKKKLDAVSDEIMTHLAFMKQSEGWRNGYIPGPKVYLNESRWEGAETQGPKEEIL